MTARVAVACYEVPILSCPPFLVCCPCVLSQINEMSQLRTALFCELWEVLVLVLRNKVDALGAARGVRALLQ